MQWYVKKISLKEAMAKYSRNNFNLNWNWQFQQFRDKSVEIIEILSKLFIQWIGIQNSISFKNVIEDSSKIVMIE